MAFLTSYRAEKIYFEKLRSNIDIAKSYIQRGATDEVMALLQNAVDADGAIMLCYRNLGEVWADLAAQLEKTQKALEDLKTALEEYHDDLNKKIDEINNYLVRLINALDERVTILENESKVKFAYLNYNSVEDVYSIEYNGETADFDALSAALEYPHLLVLIDSDSGNIYYPRSVSDVLIDFHADGVSGSNYVDISVTMTDSDVVAVTEKTVVNYTFGTGFNVSNTNEVTPDLTVLQAKLTAGTGIDIDPDTNEISADFNEVQGKLTEGFGIDIDANNEISVDTSDVQEKLIAGQNITLTPDATDPTKTVIDAGGSSYTAGNGINITNDVISTKLFGFTNGTEQFSNPHAIELSVSVSDYAKIVYSGNFIDTARRGEQIIALLQNHDVLRFIIAIASFNVPSDYANNSVEYVIDSINMTLVDSSNASIPLFIESFNKVVGFNSKGSNTQNKFPINIFLQGVNELIEYINPAETYHFRTLIDGYVKINGVALKKSDTTAILATPSVSCNFRIYA